MRGEFKPSAIIQAGYAFQNLIGLEILCNWLDSPDLYKWVQFEADHDDYPMGLDDIVACRSDDSLDLLQVKFTVDPDDTDNALSWEWLLAAKGERRSLFQKWLTAFSSLAEKQ